MTRRPLPATHLSPGFKPRYLTVAQVAKELQVCCETVYSWVRHGLIAVAHLPGGEDPPHPARGHMTLC